MKFEESNLKLHYYDSITSREISWLWYPYIPYGKITVLQGDPGEGKTTMMLQLAAMMTSGKSIPDGKKKVEPQSVIFQGAEDGLEDTIKPRLERAGADCSRVAYIDTEGDSRLFLGDHRFKEAIIRADAKLMIIDPLQAFLRGSAELQVAGGLRESFQMLSKVAEETGCAIVLIGHMNKNSSGKSIYRGLGSIDVAAAARSILLVCRDRQDPELRVMVPVKTSLAPEGSAYAFRLDARAGFRWIGECDYSADDLLGVNVLPERKLERAKKALLRMLKEDQPSKVAMENLKSLGISKRTADTAKSELGVESYKTADGWFWRLPEVGSK